MTTLELLETLRATKFTAEEIFSIIAELNVGLLEYATEAKTKEFIKDLIVARGKRRKIIKKEEEEEDDGNFHD